MPSGTGTRGDFDAPPKAYIAVRRGARRGGNEESALI
jgi:hypothetical protein